MSTAGIYAIYHPWYDVMVIHMRSHRKYKKNEGYEVCSTSKTQEKLSSSLKKKNQ